MDTGPIVAILSAADTYHEACTAQLREIRGPLLTSWPVITEAAWLLRGYQRAVQLLLSSFNGLPFQLISLDETDFAGVAAILAKYGDLKIQLADASLAHLATREGIDTMFTLDRRAFNLMRAARGKKFRIFPCNHAAR